MPPGGGYEPRGDPDSPWKDQPLYMDVGYTRAGDIGGDALRNVQRFDFGSQLGVDIFSDPPVEISMKSLFIWPAIALVLGLWWSWGTRVETGPEAGTPPQQVTLNAPVNPVVPATIQPAPLPDPRAQPAGPGHWVWIPENPANPAGWNIPPAQHH